MIDPRRWLAIISAMVSSCATPTRTMRAPSDGESYVDVMTYNVNYGLAGDPQTLDAIAAGDADLVFLQETTAAWETAIRAELSTVYPHMVFHHCCGAGGLAVLSRVPLLRADVLPADAGWFPAMRVEVRTDVGIVQVLDVHLRPAVSDSGSFVVGHFTTPKIRRAEIDAFAAHLSPDLPTLIVGDFNESSGGAVARLEGAGYTTALAEFAPSADTWRWSTSLGQISARLDHVMYDARLTPIDAKVLDAGRSDHLGVVVRFTLTPPPKR